MKKNNIELSYIVPIYNESSNIDELILRILKVTEKITTEYEIIFCADPCTDDTIEKIQNYHLINNKIKLILMSRRFGQAAATMAGLSFCKGNCSVILDADLQDPPELTLSLYDKFLNGYDVVHAKRIKRLGENKIRIFITHIGYKIINYLSSTSIPANVGDFKLISRKAINEINKLHESNIFIRGLVSFVGFKQTYVEYIRDKRLSGKPHYSQLWGSIPQALNGIYCYSNKPIYFISLIGIISAIISLFIIIIFVFLKLSGSPIASGITSVLVLISLFGGLILFSIGILGEYIGRIYEEVKSRPRYIVESLLL